MIYWIFTCLFLGLCEFFKAFASDIESELKSIEEQIQLFANRKIRNTIQSQKQQQKVKTTIHDFIAIHAEAKQLSVFRRITGGKKIFH